MLAEFIQLPKEGETIGPYLLRKVLSASILGSFYTATHKGLHEDCLLHIIPEALLRVDSRFVNRYQEVLERQKKLTSPSIIKPVESSKFGGNLVVRYKGSNFRSLSDVVAKRIDPLPADTVRQFVKTIAHGLSEAAKVNLGHYFMTPDFLFLNEEGEIRFVGLGIFQSVNYESFERFVSGAVIPIQMDRKRVFSAIEILSPEIRNFKSRDHRTDFYCLGMCTYFLLTGQKPERKWALPTQVRKDLNPGWDLFISHCLEPKPADRFPHYRSFVRDLENLEELSIKPSKDSGKIQRKLNRIPLPQALVNRAGMRSLLVMRLITLGIAGILAVGTGTIFYQILLSDFNEGESSREIRQVSTIEDANLSFTVHPEKANLKISGPESGRFFIGDRDLYLKGRSGKYIVEVTAPRRRTERREINLIASEPQFIEVDLNYAFTSVRVEAAIGTDVYVNTDEDLPIFLGTVDSPDGLLIDNRILGGKYILTARHSAFLPAETEPLDLSSILTTVTFEQERKPTELIVRSDPEGAVVFIENVKVGLTPLQIEGLAANKPLEVRIEKEGYRVVEQLLEFSKGESQVINTGELELMIGVLDYRLDLPMKETPPLQAFLFTVDNDFYRMEKASQIRLEAGEHTLRLEHPDFFPYEERIQVEDRGTLDFVISPQPRPMRLAPVIEGDHVVQYQMDGEPAELTEQGFLKIEPYKPTKVEVVIRGFHTVIQEFVGEANERVQWEIPLKPLPGAEFGENYRPPYFDLRLVWIEPQRFQMGSPVNEFRRLPNEDNLTTVRLTYGYWIAEREVTQDTYMRIMGQNPSRFEGENYPVDSVTWPKAMLFCQKLTEFDRKGGRIPEGYVYRLPTEAEWELGARAGTETPFHFGTVADPSYGNFQGYYSPGETVGRSAEDRYGTLPVASFNPNTYGLYDVHGNVAEWTLDRYWDRHPGGMVVNPYNNERGRGYPLRGGSWRDSADRVRSAAREGTSGNTSSNSIGFRIVLAPQSTDLGED